MKLLRKIGATSQILQIFIADSSSSTGAGLTGLTNASSGLTAYYHRDTDTTATSISVVTMTTGTFTSGGFKEIDATNMPGWYQFCPPNAALTSGATSVALHLKGVTNMAPLPIEIDLDGQVDVTSWNGTAVSTPATAGIPDVNVKNINNVAAATPGASGGVLISGSNSGTTTLAALTITGATTYTGNVLCSAGVTINQSTSNASALAITGNGTGHGILATAGNGNNAHGISAVAQSSAGSGGCGISVAGGDGGHGFSAVGGLAGNGAKITGITNAAGMLITGGGSGGPGISCVGQGSSAGILTTGGTTGPGISAVGGSTSGAGINVTTTSGDGISVTPTAGNALTLTANGTSKHGALITGGTAGTSDGVKCVAGTGGVDLRAAITGSITGSLSGSTGSTGSVAARVTANTDQFAGQTITAGAGVTIPSSIASPTNITAGTITTVTNLTNAPTVGDLTATMKASVTTAATASTPQLSSTGNNNVATAVFTNTLTEAYPTKGSAFTLAQALYNLVQMMNEKGIASTVMTILKRDQLTPAKTFTLNDPTNPTAVTELT